MWRLRAPASPHATSSSSIQHAIRTHRLLLLMTDAIEASAEEDRMEATEPVAQFHRHGLEKLAIRASILPFTPVHTPPTHHLPLDVRTFGPQSQNASRPLLIIHRSSRCRLPFSFLPPPPLFLSAPLPSVLFLILSFLRFHRLHSRLHRRRSHCPGSTRRTSSLIQLPLLPLSSCQHRHKLPSPSLLPLSVPQATPDPPTTAPSPPPSSLYTPHSLPQWHHTHGTLPATTESTSPSPAPPAPPVPTRTPTARRQAGPAASRAE